MKRSILIFVIIFGYSYTYCQCAKDVSLIGTLSTGGNNMGFNVQSEFGVWGVDQPLGATIGFDISNYWIVFMKDGKEVRVKEPQIHTYLRVTAKIIQIEDKYFHLLTGMVGFNNIGGSYRFYRSIGEYTLLGGEISYTTKMDMGLNILLTFTF